nr:reverse transcriptase domain-containing protein [Tanacetum cinerariifolium]
MLKAGKLSYLIKELNQTKDYQKIRKGPSKVIFNQWERPSKVSKRGGNLRKGQAAVNTDGDEDGMEGSMIIEAKIGGNFVHRMYVNEGTLDFHMDQFHRSKVTIHIQRNHIKARSKENLGCFVYSSRNAKILSDRRYGHIAKQQDYSIRLHNGFRTSSAAARNQPSHRRKFQVAIHLEYPEQTTTIGSTLTEEGRKELCGLPRRNLDIFARKPADMIGVSRHIAEHRLNIHQGYLPVRQKKRGKNLREIRQSKKK